MSISAEIIADSINPKGKRLTTFILEYPRFIHSEVLTHRQFSKNAASSRAISVEKMIQGVINNPAMPVWWGKHQKGMQANEEVDDLEKSIFSHSEGGGIVGEYNVFKTPKEYCKDIWLEARDSAIEFVYKLNKAGLHKQITNRLLEPWFNIRVILSGTEFENFFALRAHSDAQPEFQELAFLMLREYNNSIPKILKKEDWHIPFGDGIQEERVISNFNLSSSDVSLIEDYKKKIAIARCARVSYLNFEGKDDYLKDIETCNKLFNSTPKHLSPTEHVAQAQDDEEYYGNFCGFKQYRKFILDENLTDNRVKKK